MKQKLDVSFCIIMEHSNNIQDPMGDLDNYFREDVIGVDT